MKFYLIVICAYAVLARVQGAAIINNATQDADIDYVLYAIEPTLTTTRTSAPPEATTLLPPDSSEIDTKDIKVAHELNETVAEPVDDDELGAELVAEELLISGPYGTLEDFATVPVDAAAESESASPSAKLLLLSAPRAKPMEVEELVEQEDELGSGDSTTTMQPETTTTLTYDDVEATALNSSTTIEPAAVDVELYVYNLTQDASKNESAKAQVSIEDQSIAPPSHNQQSVVNVLAADEDEFVLLRHEVEDVGSYTHSESAEYLQPYVQSVEIVPTYFDAPFIVRYSQVERL